MRAQYPLPHGPLTDRESAWLISRSGDRWDARPSGTVRCALGTHTADPGLPQPARCDEIAVYGHPCVWLGKDRLKARDEPFPCTSGSDLVEGFVGIRPSPIMLAQ